MLREQLRFGRGGMAIAVEPSVVLPEKITNLFDLFDTVKAAVDPKRPDEPESDSPTVIDIFLSPLSSEGQDVYRVRVAFDPVVGVYSMWVERGADTELRHELSVVKPAKFKDHQKALELLERVDIQRVYPMLERETENQLKRDPRFWRLYKRFLKTYDDPRIGTAAVQWEEDVRKYRLFIDRRFAVSITLSHLLNGFPHSNFKFFNKMFDGKPLDILVQPWKFILCHEVSHIIYRHTNREEGLYDEYDHSRVNEFGDMFINLKLTDVLWGQLNSNLVDPRAYGNEMVYEGQIQDGSAVQGVLQQVLSGFGSVSPSITNPVPSEPCEMVCKFHPMPFVTTGTPTAIIMNVFLAAIAALDLQKMEDDEEGTAPPPKPPDPEKALFPGQVVRNNQTKGLVMVTGVEEPDPKTGRQKVTLVPVEDLSPEAQEHIRKSVESPDDGETEKPVPDGYVPMGADDSPLQGPE